MAEEIIISDYNVMWHSEFLLELKQIMELLDMSKVIDIQHFGSTSIPGMASKPILDILVGFHSMDDAYQSLSLLDPMNYTYIEALSVPGGRLFHQKNPRTRHVHFVEYGTEHWNNPIVFRNYMRLHPKEQQAYTALKMRNSEQFRKDRNGYTQAKTSFVTGIVQKAIVAGK
jgi:GrpB-like predicted nucleotidyltransferase (UPF0157 family)